MIAGPSEGWPLCLSLQCLQLGLCSYSWAQGQRPKKLPNIYLKIETFQGLECVCCNTSLSLGSHLIVGCSDAVPLAEGWVQGVLLGLSCLHIPRLQKVHLCKWHFHWSAALQLLLGGLGEGRRRSTVSWGEEWDRASSCTRELRTQPRCELGVPLAQSTIPATVPISWGCLCQRTWTQGRFALSSWLWLLPLWISLQFLEASF